MNKKYCFIKWAGILIFIILFSQCAQIVPLTGGEKDSQAPIIQSIIPHNNYKRFSSDKIIINFDEKIQLINPNDNIIITPTIKKNIEYKIKNKTLEIHLNPLELLSNTTYKIIFNKCIADLSERNVLNFFEYVFSTGTYIDSFYIKGKIYNAYTLMPEKSMLVALYDVNKNDSVPLKEKPVYFTKTNENGEYIIKNLPDKKFKLIAFSDDNNNFFYDPIKEKIAFTPNDIYPPSDTIIDLFAEKEIPSVNHLKKYYQLNKYQINLIYSFPDKYKAIHNNNNIFLINDSTYNDTCKIFVHNTDTAKFLIQNSTQIDTFNIPLNKKLKPHPTYYILNNINAKQSYFMPIIIQSNFWIDENYIRQKTILYQNKDSNNLIKNTNITTLPFQIQIHYSFLQNTSYTLKIPIKPIDYNDSIRYQTFEIKTNSAEDYAQLKVNVLVPQKKNYILALCNQQHKIIYSKTINPSISSSNLQTIEFNNIVPDTYILKLIQDDNQNNQWDPPQYIYSKQNKTFAEKIFVYPKTIKLINNWDVNIDWKKTE